MMTLPFALALISGDEGFGHELTREFAFGQADKVLRAAALGMGTEVRGQPWNPVSDPFATEDDWPGCLYVRTKNGALAYKKSDSRIRLVSCSPTRESRLRAPTAEQAISKEDAKAVLERVVHECGYDAGVKIDELKFRKLKSGEIYEVEVRFQPVWGGVSFDWYSQAIAELDPVSGRVFTINMWTIPRIPTNMEVRVNIESGRATIKRELSRLKLKDVKTVQEPVLVITPKREEDWPDDLLDRNALAWEKSPESTLAYEGYYSGIGNIGGLGQMVTARILVDAKSGKVMRVQTLPPLSSATHGT